VKAVAESAMREVVGKTELTSILTTGRGKVQNEAAELMQKTLDSWGAGVSVVEVQIRSRTRRRRSSRPSARWPTPARTPTAPVNEANTYRNRVINEAKGDASKITQSAEGYREQAAREAQGEAARFNQIYTEYKRAPGATRDRLYIETMQRVLPSRTR
jgi:membrane protease subunit HflK